MEHDKMLDMALERILGDLDDVEGKSAMSHSQEECPDPFNCKEHDTENASNLAKNEINPGDPSVSIEVHKGPTMEGGTADEPGELSPEEVEALKKLVR